MSPAPKRRVILEWRRQGLSLRLALDLVQLARGSFYRRSRGRPQEEAWRERIREVALAQASFGYRRITAFLRRPGWQVNPKRVYRWSRQTDWQKTGAPLRAAGADAAGALGAYRGGCPARYGP